MPTYKETQVTFTTPPEYIEHANAFFKAYNSLIVVSCPEQKIKDLKPKAERICRFCGKGAVETTFRTNAHVFPEFLGNRYLVSDFECDECNNKFGREYENDLANFLGPILLIQGINGKDGIGKFRGADKKLKAQPTALGSRPVIQIAREDVTDDSMILDDETGKGSISYVKNSYVPLRVYKALLKIALSCLPEDQLLNYKLAFKYLLDAEDEKIVTGIQTVFTYQTHMFFGHRSPMAFLYQKRDVNEKIPTHTIVIYFANQMYQLFLPFHKDDIRLIYNKPGIEVHICPPFFADWETAQSVKVVHNVFDFRSGEMVRKERQSMHFEVNVEDLKNAVVVDLNKFASESSTETLEEQ